MKKNKKNICSICGKEYNGFGNNAQPINNGRCCDCCNNKVIYMRMLISIVYDEIENKAEDIVEMKTENGLFFYYHKSKGIITDCGKVFIAKITDENVEDAMNFLKVVAPHYKCRICDYNHLKDDFIEFMNEILPRLKKKGLISRI